MKVLIADDEAVARSRLRALLAEIDKGVAVVGEAADGRETLRMIAETEPDAVLLDVCMPRMSGVEVAKTVVGMPHPPAVIFTTAFDEYALDAFEICVVGYLLKPIRKERLITALEKARRYISITAGTEKLAPEPEPQGGRGHLCSYSHGELRLIPIGEVVFFKAESKYTTIRTETEERLIEESLSSLEQEFSNRFLRIHRNALVAKDRIEALVKLGAGSMGIRLKGIPEKPEVSRRHLPEVRAWLKQRGEVRQED